jgi:DNA-binding NarL/FixJ family response regulator
MADVPNDPYDKLTTREREVLHLAAEGFTNPQISERLFISPRTTETHRANLMRKLELDSQSELIRYAVKRGIVSLDS